MPSPPQKKTGRKKSDEVDTATNMSQASTILFEKTTQTITNLSTNEKMPNKGSMIKEHEITGVWMLRDGNHQVTTSARKEDDTDSDKKGPVLGNDYLCDTRTRTHHEDKRKNQITTIYS